MKEWILENTVVTEERYDSLINPNTVKMLEFERKEDKLYELSNHPIVNIDNFTHKKPTITRCMIYGIKKRKKYYIYKDIEFRVFSELLTIKNNPFIEELYSDNRIGTCFDKSIQICLSNDNSKILTAMCIDPFLQNHKKFIHSFVCVKGKDGKEYIVDGTINTVIEKEKYMKIYNAQIITEIDKNKFESFMDFIIENGEFGNYISIVEYLCFPDEVIEGIEKHIKTR